MSVNGIDMKVDAEGKVWIIFTASTGRQAAIDADSLADKFLLSHGATGVITAAIREWAKDRRDLG